MNQPQKQKFDYGTYVLEIKHKKDSPIRLARLKLKTFEEAVLQRERYINLGFYEAIIKINS